VLEAKQLDVVQGQGTDYTVLRLFPLRGCRKASVEIKVSPVHLPLAPLDGKTLRRQAPADGLWLCQPNDVETTAGRATFERQDTFSNAMNRQAEHNTARNDP